MFLKPIQGLGRTFNHDQIEATGGEKDPIRKKASDGGGRKDATSSSQGGGSSRNRSDKESGNNSLHAGIKQPLLRLIFNENHFISPLCVFL
jgi:hypothetical protein